MQQLRQHKAKTYGIIIKLRYTLHNMWRNWDSYLYGGIVNMAMNMSFDPYNL